MPLLNESRDLGSFEQKAAFTVPTHPKLAGSKSVQRHIRKCRTALKHKSELLRVLVVIAVNSMPGAKADELGDDFAFGTQGRHRGSLKFLIQQSWQSPSSIGHVTIPASE